jgi:hypothetical protein
LALAPALVLALGSGPKILALSLALVWRQPWPKGRGPVALSCSLLLGQVLLSFRAELKNKIAKHLAIRWRSMPSIISLQSPGPPAHESAAIALRWRVLDFRRRCLVFLNFELQVLPGFANRKKQKHLVNGHLAATGSAECIAGKLLKFCV